MTVKYKQFVRAKISNKKFRQILRAFALDLTATQIAVLTNLNRNTSNRYLRLIRQSIARFCEQESPFSGVVELDGLTLEQNVPKANVVAERRIKQSFSVSTNAMEKSIPRLSRM
jgi:hypothetical protein